MAIPVQAGIQKGKQATESMKQGLLDTGFCGYDGLESGNFPNSEQLRESNALITDT